MFDKEIKHLKKILAKRERIQKGTRLFPKKVEEYYPNSQSRKPVCRNTAFLTWRRSLPFKVLPAPSRTEHDRSGDCAKLLATISCGGNISASPSSASASTSAKKSRGLLIASDSIGTFTGADWWYLTEELIGVMRS